MGIEYSGRANFWTLYQTDDVSSTTVAVVKDDTGAVIGVVVGKDIAIECNITGRTCEYRVIGSGTELHLVRETGTFPNQSIDKTGNIGGDSLIANLGINAKAKQGNWNGKINGNFTTSILNDRALLGHGRFRFRFTELYGEYSQPNWRARMGRQFVPGGQLLDGVAADYFLGPDYSKESKFVGVFAGLAPDPISKNPSKDFMTFGPKFQWIPDFSSQGETKLLVEGAVVTELYKGAVNRFYLNSRIHFTPVRTFSSTLYSNLELPWKGDDGGFGSSLLSFQNFWRPNNQFNFLLGFTQFRIDRNLQEEAVRWVTDGGSQQATRVGDSLDRSQRYRVDARLSYKIIPEFQPYLKGRYERRTFDSNKTNLNSDDNTPATRNLFLLNQKNAYQATAGGKFYVFDHLETDSSATYGQRFQSKFYSLYQSALWEGGADWNVDGYFQYIWSRRTQDKSLPNQLGEREISTDIYVGAGASYRFMTDFLAQIRYDLGHEDDRVLDSNVMSHTVLLRLDYKF